jgi:hypothetical protein
LCHLRVPDDRIVPLQKPLRTGRNHFLWDFF